MYYLRKLKVILEHTEYREHFGPLRERLAPEGISVEIQVYKPLTNAEYAEAEKRPSGAVPSATDIGGEGVLWLADNPSLASRLAAESRPVLAYLHPQNKEQDFYGVRYACEEPAELELSYLEGVYRRCNRLPLDILTTERLFLRETTVEDVEEFYHIYANPSITQYMEGLYPDKEQEKEYIREYIEKIYCFYDFGVWTVGKRDTGEIIGRAGFAYREGFEEPEIGFVIGVPWQRQGYAFEICCAILEYGFERLEFGKIRALVEPRNEASLRLCEKLGMKYEKYVTCQETEYICLTT